MTLSKSEIADQNEYLLKCQRDFRIAAEYVARAMSNLDEVQRIVLFGSVAKPLEKEIPRFYEFQREGIAIWHECKDVDIAVWVRTLDNLRALRKAKVLGLKTAAQEKNVTTATHQVDVFMMDAATNRHIGRLCDYKKCPRSDKKLACMTPGCGQPAYLKQIPGFRLDPAGLATNVSVVLFERRHG
ncbi:MAG: hypothetical protein IH624_07350 [Phycisphaerae bacterium]|nr:hypothetical protein [Phycisphaerae bacterium]